MKTVIPQTLTSFIRALLIALMLSKNLTRKTDYLISFRKNKPSK